VSSAHFNNSQTALTLVRLCEIDPDGWTEHMAVTRDPLHAQWVRIRERRGLEAMRASQDKLALQIYRSIGFDRLCKDLGRLSVVTDAPFWMPTDNWLWRALLERARVIVPLPDGRIAAADRKNDPRKLIGTSPRYAPPAAGDKKPPSVDQALGVNSLVSEEEEEASSENSFETSTA
jgi:hypothetical protein